MIPEGLIILQIIIKLRHPQSYDERAFIGLIIVTMRLLSLFLAQIWREGSVDYQLWVEL